MSGYKLTYFNIPGLGEPIRFLLSYAGVDFEDNRITKESWPELKPKTPLEQLPILEVDGKTLYQSNAIIRFLARKYNLFGNGESENFDVDVAIETIGEMRQVISKWSFIPDPEVKAATKEETFAKVAFFLKKLDATVEKNGGFFVGGKITAADIVFAGYSISFNQGDHSKMADNFKNLKRLVEKIIAEPAIQSYLAKRSKADH